MIPNLANLGSLVKDLHQSLEHLFYLMLPAALILAVVIGYLKSGDANYPELLKRAFVTVLLLISFPEISNVILDICDGIAQKIDSMSGLETFLRMAQEKSQTYATAKNVLLLKFDDIFIATLSFGSFILLYVARYITIALYYFYWTLLSICSPLMILCYVFPQTANITANLYRGLIEVACWKILWAIMSAMLTSLAFGDMYKAEGSYLTLIIMNFVIAIALLFTPKIMRSLIAGGVQGSAESLGVTAAAAILALPIKIASARTISREVMANTKNYFSPRANSLQRPVSKPKPKGGEK